MTQPQREPGWYPDALDASQERWWDGSDWTRAMRPKVTSPPKADDAGAKVLGGMLWAIIGVFVLMFVGCVAIISSGSDDDGGEEFGEYEASYMCEEFVKDRIKSPGSAEFQRPTRTAAGVDTWTVTGTLDAQNSFGALVRMTYECTVRGADGNATLVNLDLVE